MRIYPSPVLLDGWKCVWVSRRVCRLWSRVSYVCVVYAWRASRCVFMVATPRTFHFYSAVFAPHRIIYIMWEPAETTPILRQDTGGRSVVCRVESSVCVWVVEWWWPTVYKRWMRRRCRCDCAGRGGKLCESPFCGSFAATHTDNRQIERFVSYYCVYVCVPFSVTAATKTFIRFAQSTALCVRAKTNRHVCALCTRHTHKKGYKKETNASRGVRNKLISLIDGAARRCWAYAGTFCG